MKYIVRVLMVLALSLSGATVAAAQGLYWEQKTTAFGKDRTSEMYAMPKMIKVVQDGQHIILRSDKEQMIMIDPAKKTYRVMPFSELESVAKSAQDQMQAAMAKAQEQMKSV